MRAQLLPTRATKGAAKRPPLGFTGPIDNFNVVGWAVQTTDIKTG
jgi:hypothetical protein